MDSAEQQSKGEPDLSYFLELRPATQIMHLMFAFINTALVPLAQTSLTTRREMGKLSGATLKSLEQKINAIIQKTVGSKSTTQSPILRVADISKSRYHTFPPSSPNKKKQNTVPKTTKSALQPSILQPVLPSNHSFSKSMKSPLLPSTASTASTSSTKSAPDSAACFSSTSKSSRSTRRALSCFRKI
jgi:hypothetical protein